MTSIDVAHFDGLSLKGSLDDFNPMNGFSSPIVDDPLKESPAVSRTERAASGKTKQRAESAKKQECVTVVVRCRPMSPKEKAMGYLQVVEMWPDQGTVLIRNPKENHKDPVKTFTFDAVYDWSSTQQDLFDETVRPLIESVLNGFNATIFAYGQTGTGKTYTMEGCKSSLSTTEGDERGVIPKSFEQIFTHISRTTDKQHLVRASYLEIYQEEIRDLLDKDPRKRYELKESKEIGVYVKGLRSFVCKSVKEIEHVMQVGNRNRTIGATDMNEHSSRSHAIFMITVEMSDLCSAKGQVRVGKLNLVDLAGSERQAKTGATGDRLKEASKINLSLSALGNVISALVDDKCQYIPYRDSKLTRLLQDSLGGNSKTLMVANIGPASYNYDESLTTLRYANRAKNIQNQPRINEDPKDALIRQYQEEIERLRTLLVERTHKSPSEAGEDLSWEQQNEYYKREAEELDQRKANILMNEHKSEEAKAKELQALEEKRRLIEGERKYAMELNEKIQSMESKLLQGGKNIMDHTNEQQKALEKHMAEIRERKQQSLQMQKRLEEVEESAESIRISYSNLLEEVEAKKKQLSKIVAKCQRIKQEISDSVEEHSQFRRDLELSQKNLMKEIKLDRLIIDNFVPLEERKNVEERLVYDDNEKSWRVLPDDSISYSIGRLVANAGCRRPTCEYTKELLNAREFHVGGENILLLELDSLPRSTKDYESTAIPSSLKLMLQTALKEEEDIEIDAAPSRSSSRVRDRSRGTSVVRGASGIVRNGKYYPQSRGLVSK